MMPLSADLCRPTAQISHGKVTGQQLTCTTNIPFHYHVSLRREDLNILIRRCKSVSEDGD